MSTTWLITGASRGLGLRYTEEILKSGHGDCVIATCRTPAKATGLHKLAEQYKGRLATVALDVTDASSIKAAVAEVESLDMARDGLDVLVNNAGIAHEGFKNALESTSAGMRKDFETNVFGVVDVTQAFLPLVRKGKGKKLILVGSLVGNFETEWSKTPDAANYTSSKSAVHMWFKKLGNALGDEFTCVVMSPGFVATEFHGIGEEGGAISLDVAGPQGVALFRKLSPKDNGKMWTFDDLENPVPW